MAETFTGTIPSTKEWSNTSIEHSYEKISQLESRLASLEEDFIKLTAFVNIINSKLK